MKLYYHGTTDLRLIKIMKEGLVPKAEKNSSIWNFGKKVKAVCFTPNFNKAIYWANRKRIQDEAGNPIVITLNLKGLTILDTNSKSTDNEKCILGKVESHRILNFIGVDNKTKKEVLEELNLEE